MKSRCLSTLMERIVGDWAAQRSLFDIPGELTRRGLERSAAGPEITPTQTPPVAV